MAWLSSPRDQDFIPLGSVGVPGDTQQRMLQGGGKHTDSNGNTTAPVSTSPDWTWRTTYSVGFTLVVVAGDAVTITPASKILRITRIKLTGNSSVATSSAVDISLIKRSTVDTAGTSTTPTPVALDSLDATVTGVVRAYTVAPTLGTALGAIAMEKYSPGLAPETATDFPDIQQLEWLFGNRPSHGVVLRTTSEQLAINFGTTPAATNSFNFTLEWSEE